MKKKLLGLLIVLVLIVVMIPIMATAETKSASIKLYTTECTIDQGAAPKYYTVTNGEPTLSATPIEDTYNIKLEYPSGADAVPTMYVRNTHLTAAAGSNYTAVASVHNDADKFLIVVEKSDAVANGAADFSWSLKFDWRHKDLEICGYTGTETSPDPADCATISNSSWAGCMFGGNGSAITFKNINVKLTAAKDGGAERHCISGVSAITFDGGSAVITSADEDSNAGSAIVGCSNLTVKNGNVTLKGKYAILASGSNRCALNVEGGTLTGIGNSYSFESTDVITSNYKNPNGDNYCYVTRATNVEGTEFTANASTKYYKFEPAYPVTVANGSADKTSYPVGATVTLTPGTAPAGQAFVGFSSNDVTIAENEGVYTFTMPAKNVAVTANFIKSAAVKLDGVEYTFSDTNSRYFTTNAAGEITEDGTVDAYNIKLAYNGDMPTVYLKNAFIAADADAIENHTGAALTINVEAASRITHANAATNTEIENAGTGAAIKTAGSVTITGSGLLKTESQNRSGNIIRVTSAFASGAIVKFENANIEFNATGSKAWNEEGFRGTPAKYVFDGGKVTINTGYLNILANSAATVVEIINNAEVNANSTVNGFIYAPSGSIVIDGGNLKINGYNAITNLTKLEIKSGTMEVTTTSGNVAAVAPDLTAYTNAYAVLGASKAEATEYTGGALSGKYFKIGSASDVYTVTVTDGSAQYTVKAFAGDTVVLKPGTAPEGQVFAGWTVTSNNATPNGSSFVMPSENVTVSANYGVAGSITIGANEYSAVKGGAAVYFKTDANGVVTLGGDENDYNLKFVYADEEGAVPTLYLKGANVAAAIKSNAFSAGTTKIVTETDSTVTGAITWSTGKLIISGSGKLALSKTITTTGANLVFKDANVELKTGTAGGLSGKDITFDGGKFVYESTAPLISDWGGASGPARTILVTGNAQVTVTSEDQSAIVLVNPNASFVVNSGHVKLISNGVYVNSTETDGWGSTLRGTGTFKFNGGTIEVIGNEYAVYSGGVKIDLTGYENYFATCANNTAGTGAVGYTNTEMLTQYNTSFQIKYFKFAPAYTITVNGATANTSKASAGTEIVLTPERRAGYKLDSWTIDNGSATVTIENNKFTMPEGNVSITANYVEDPNADAEPDEVVFKFAGTKVTVVRGETYYFITKADGTVTAENATEDNYNIKVEYERIKDKTPVIYLRGAYIKGSYGSIINNDYGSLCTDNERASKVTIVVEKELGNAVSAVPADVTADSYLVSYIFLSKGGVEVQGPGKLVMDATTVKEGGADKVISAKIQTTGDLTFKNADVQILNGALKGANITFDGGKVDITADDEVIVSIWQNPHTVLVTNDADVTFTSNKKAAMHIVGTDAAKAALQIDSGSLVLKSNATGTNTENAALKMAKADLKINGGTLELIGSVAVVTGNIEMTLNGNFDAICANNVDGTGAVAYKDTTLKQYNSSFQLKYFKIQPGTGSSDDDSGNSGTGTDTHKHSTTKVRGKAASCTADGVKEHYKCSCGKFFEDKAAKKEIKDIDTWKVIKATGHKDTNKDGICETCKKSAQTSDSSFTALWITLLTVSAMGMCVTFVYNKKKATK